MTNKLKFTDQHYRALPHVVEIRPNEHGHGLFAKENIAGGSILGITHYMLEEQERKDYLTDAIRTPLGGFINHSDTPNGLLVPRLNVKELWAVRPIKVDEEITIYYNQAYYDIIPNFGGPKDYRK